MPVETKLVYAIANLKNGKVNMNDLIAEIQASTIATALELPKTRVVGANVEVTFKDKPSAADKTTFDGAATDPANDPPSVGSIMGDHAGNDPVQLDQVEFPAPQQVEPRRSETAGRGYCFTPDLTNKTTWYYKSVEVLNEAVGTGDGVTTVFSLAQNDIISLEHGLVTDEDLISLPVGATLTSWRPVVKLDGVAQTMREPYAGSGGDFEVNYATGDITFFVAPALGVAVTASYFHANTGAGSSIIDFKPPAGKKWVIDMVEAQFAKDIVINDTMLFGFVLGETWVEPPTEYKTGGAYLDFSFGSHPVIPAFGGATRGLTQDTIILRWEYLASIVITASSGVCLRLQLETDAAFGGERAAVTFYALEEDE